MAYCGQFLEGLNTDCLGSRGGLKEIWISSNHVPFTLDIEDGVIKYVSDGSVDVPVGNFHQYKFKKGNASMNSSVSFDTTSGLHYISTEISITFSRIETAKRIEMEKLANAKDMVVIVKDNNNHWWYLGKDYPVTLTSSKGNFGSKKSDSNSYQITLSCYSDEYPLETLDLPWEHRGKPMPPFHMESDINLYCTYSDDVKNKEKWMENESELIGYGIFYLDEEHTINYTGSDKFLGWYDGDSGELLSTDKEYTFTIEDIWYDIIAKLEEPIKPTKIIHYTSTDGEIVEPYNKFAFGYADIISNTYEDGMGTIVVNDDVTTIGNQAFFYCQTLKSIEIPDSVTSIGKNAFQNCENISTITIPNSVVYMNEGVFFRCYLLNNIEIPESITMLSHETFYQCTNLNTVTIHKTMQLFDNETFYGCYALKNINYDGTKTQFSEIGKLPNWNTYVPTSCIVHCTDGNYPITDFE